VSTAARLHAKRHWAAMPQKHKRRASARHQVDMHRMESFQQPQIRGKERGGSGATFLLRVVPNFNARVIGNDSWGYVSSNKCQGNQKVVQFLSPGAALECAAHLARPVSVTGSQSSAGPVRRHPLQELLLNASTVRLTLCTVCIIRPRNQEWK
jgi:hypothetical protein